MRVLSKFLALFAVLLAFAPTLVLAQSAVLLPNGKQQFLSATGAPLSGGSVGFYIANTLTPKTTWQDAGQSTPNTNPVTLDAAGEALIYGVGTYRQIVKDASGNTIWDAQTSGLGGSTFAATSTGTANAQVISAGNFSGQNGQQVSFIAGFTNTSSMTLNAGTGVFPVVRDSSSGPVALSGGEVTAGNVIVAAWDSGGSQFHLISNNTLANITAASTQIPFNLGLTATVAGNALTISIVNTAGVTPTGTSPVYVPFRSSTATTGTLTLATISSGTSVVISNGSTLGTGGSIPTSLWVAAFYNAGVVSVGVINPIITPVDAIVSTTAEGGVGTANSAGVWYTTSALTNVPMTILGRIDITEATAGVWASAPTIVQVGTPATLAGSLPRVNTSGLVATTSGTTVSFAIPAGVRHIDVNLNGVSTSNVNGLILQIGDGGGTETTGYVGSGAYTAGAATQQVSVTTGFGLLPVTVAADTYNGVISLSLTDSATAVWSESGIISSTGRLSTSSGTKALSPGPLTTVTLATVGGDTFDAGSASVNWWF